MFRGQRLYPAGEGLQRGQEGDARSVAGGTEPGDGVDLCLAAQGGVLDADVVRGGDEDVRDLVQGGGAGFDGGPGGVVEGTYAADGVVLGDDRCPAGQRGAGGCVGVDGVGLADPATLGLVGPVDLDHGQARLAGGTGEPQAGLDPES
ncbi:hypothetical protein [Streptomyces hydrogenans]|uniref:hypothetical protein n=1 Tax=Streptomyces hydrogenans TaxID=1873719 RepID=UPI0037FCF1B2